MDNPSAHVSGGRGFKPQQQQIKFQNKILIPSQVMIAMIRHNFPISLPFNTTCLELPRFLVNLMQIVDITQSYYLQSLHIILLYPALIRAQSR